jgi:hypothetical protein
LKNIEEKMHSTHKETLGSQKPVSFMTSMLLITGFVMVQTKINALVLHDS